MIRSRIKIGLLALVAMSLSLVFAQEEVTAEQFAAQHPEPTFALHGEELNPVSLLELTFQCLGSGVQVVVRTSSPPVSTYWTPGLTSCGVHRRWRPACGARKSMRRRMQLSSWKLLRFGVQPRSAILTLRRRLTLWQVTTHCGTSVCTLWSRCRPFRPLRCRGMLRGGRKVGQADQPGR